jgi:NADH-quinone oxidoreductase subunit L
MPGLAGFFSKDAILALAVLKENWPVFGLLAFTAVLTAFYMVRMWKIVFLGAARSEESDHAHEGGIALTAPLVVLAALSVIAGYPFIRTAVSGMFGDVLDLVPEVHDHDHTVVFATSIVVLLVGAVAAFLFYKPATTDALAEKAPGVFGGLAALKASFDRVYDYYVAKVQQRFAMLLNFLDQILLSGVIIRGLSGIVGLFGLGARALHVGNVNAYAYWFLLGIAVLWAFATGMITFS